MNDDDIQKALDDYTSAGDPPTASTREVVALVTSRRHRRRAVLSATVGILAVIGGTTFAVAGTDRSDRERSPPATTSGPTPSPDAATCGPDARGERFAITQPKGLRRPAGEASISGKDPLTIPKACLAPDHEAEVANSDAESTLVQVTDTAGATVNLLAFAPIEDESAWRITHNTVCLRPYDGRDTTRPGSCGGQVAGLGDLTYEWPEKQPENLMGVAQYVGQARVPACAVLHVCQLVS